MGGIDLRVVSTSSEPAEFTLELDAGEPYLGHHRPGGHPLLGTVMGIELMARSVAKISSASPSEIAHVSKVVVGDPIIVAGTAATAYLHVTRSIGEAGHTFHCEVETRDDHAVTHFRATVAYAEPQSPKEAMQVNHMNSPLPVQAADVYALFFHGPAFQVIKRAGLVNDEAIAEVAADLVDLTSDPADIEVLAPRLIEACLQTAGLLEIATRSRMMIPARIGNIDFFGDQASLPDQLFTRAHRSIALNGGEAIDVDLVDVDGNPWLKVTGYETRPLPFPSDSAAVENLSKAFRSTALAT